MPRPTRAEALDALDSGVPVHALQQATGLNPDDTPYALPVEPRAPATIQYASVAAAASGANTLVAAVSGKRLVVVNYVLVAADVVSANWASATTDISGALPLAANGGIVAAGHPGAPLLRTAVGEALALELSAAVAVGGHLAYYEE